MAWTNLKDLFVTRNEWDSVSQVTKINVANHTTINTHAYRYGNLVVVTGTGALSCAPWDIVVLTTGLPVAAHNMTAAVATQGTSNKGAIVSIYEDKTSLALETKDMSVSNGYLFFGFCYLTK